MIAFLIDSYPIELLYFSSRYYCILTKKLNCKSVELKLQTIIVTGELKRTTLIRRYKINIAFVAIRTNELGVPYEEKGTCGAMARSINYDFNYHKVNSETRMVFYLRVDLAAQSILSSLNIMFNISHSL